jgi:hypothetical protein
MNRPPSFSERALNVLEGKEPDQQLALLFEYVRQGEIDQIAGDGPSDDEINILRRRYVRIASEIYRTNRRAA